VPPGGYGRQPPNGRRSASPGRLSATAVRPRPAPQRSVRTVSGQPPGSPPPPRWPAQGRDRRGNDRSAHLGIVDPRASRSVAFNQQVRPLPETLQQRECGLIEIGQQHTRNFDTGHAPSGGGVQCSPSCARWLSAQHRPWPPRLSRTVGVAATVTAPAWYGLAVPLSSSTA
jgi:hypothetical protein